MVTLNDVVRKEVTPSRASNVEYILKGKSLIVEFVGPTGSGKTTNCFHFSELCKKHNLDTYVFSDVKGYLYQLKFYQRLGIYFKTLFIHRADLLSYVFLLACNGIYSFDSAYRYIKLCIFNVAMNQFIKNKNVDVLLLDQWIIQCLWSATIFKTRSYTKLQDKLKRFYFKTDCVLYFDIDEETACERIQSRESDLSRFDRMHDKKRLAELRRYNHYLYQLYENSECENKFIFSTKVSPVKNAQDFFMNPEYSVVHGK